MGLCSQKAKNGLLSIKSQRWTSIQKTINKPYPNETRNGVLVIKDHGISSRGSIGGQTNIYPEKIIRGPRKSEMDKVRRGQRKDSNQENAEMDFYA